MKRKLYEDGALPAPSEGSKKVIKKVTTTVAMATQGTPTIISVPTAQVVVASGRQGSPSSQASLKKQKTAGESGKLTHVINKKTENIEAKQSRIHILFLYSHNII